MVRDNLNREFANVFSEMSLKEKSEAIDWGIVLEEEYMYDHRGESRGAIPSFGKRISC